MLLPFFYFYFLKWKIKNKTDDKAPAILPAKTFEKNEILLFDVLSYPINLFIGEYNPYLKLP